VAHIIHPLRTLKDEEADTEKLGITALTPYTKQTKQAKYLRGAILNWFDVQAYTIVSFQGREDDIVKLSTVLCNVHDDIGFVEDTRRPYVSVLMLVLTLTKELLSGMSHGRGQNVLPSLSGTRRR
jgi:hypothetical protein